MKRKAILICSFATVLSGAVHALTMDTVTVGNPGNLPDPLNYNLATGLHDYGAVSYTYNIGKYEVTLNQYTEFLNAVADTDTFNLYHTNMGTDPSIKGITRSGNSGSYSYAVFGDGQRPVTYVSWFDAARFCNWLHNGQPSGLQVAGTTETGAYALNGTISGVVISRGGGAQYWIPSENEWYKAAYYQPAAAGGDADGYWLYPMQTNIEPYSDQPAGATPDNTRVGNFYGDDGIANGYNDGFAVSGVSAPPSTPGGGLTPPSENILTPVGAYTASDSYYGTFDQGGNVGEWNEAIYYDAARGQRGGSWGIGGEAMQSAGLAPSAFPTGQGRGTGFRIASVPEPTVGVSLILAGGLLLARRKRPSAL